MILKWDKVDKLHLESFRSVMEKIEPDLNGTWTEWREPKFRSRPWLTHRCKYRHTDRLIANVQTTVRGTGRQTKTNKRERKDQLNQCLNVDGEGETRIIVSHHFEKTNVWPSEDRRRQTSDAATSSMRQKIGLKRKKKPSANNWQEL